MNYFGIAVGLRAAWLCSGGVGYRKTVEGWRRIMPSGYSGADTVAVVAMPLWPSCQRCVGWHWVTTEAALSTRTSSVGSCRLARLRQSRTTIASPLSKSEASTSASQRNESHRFTTPFTLCTAPESRGDAVQKGPQAQPGPPKDHAQCHPYAYSQL